MAIVHPSAKIADDVEIGPWSFIGADVEIGSGCKINSHVVIKGPCKIGKNNYFYQFSSIGDDPQDKKYQGERSFLEIGDNNIIRECATINRGTRNGGGLTRIGDNNLLMAYVHIAHDSIVGNHTVFANNASLSGHVIVKDHAILSGFAAVHQFTTVGEHSFVAGATMVVKDVLPFVLVSGDPAGAHGLNNVGLKRRGFDNETVMTLRRAYKIIFRQGLTVNEAIEKLKELDGGDSAEVHLMIEALMNSSRGITR